MRAQRLAALGLGVVVDESTLDADTLARAIDDAAGRAGTRSFDFDLDGARRSAEIVAGLLMVPPAAALPPSAEAHR
jgi:predicted glycosyltransferase